MCQLVTSTTRHYCLFLRLFKTVNQFFFLILKIVSCSRAFDEERGLNLIREAFKCGVNYIETGPWYGQGSSERTVGKVNGLIVAFLFFLSTKQTNFRPENIRGILFL